MRKNEYPINKSEMGKRIKEARRKVHLTQLELGNKVNVTDVAISRYEHGRVTPRLKTLVAIAVITKTPIEWFFDMPADHNDLDEFNAALHEIQDLCLSMTLEDLEYVISFLKRISSK